MRHPCALGILSVLIANLAVGCTPYIPVEDAFTTSSLKPTGNIPSEFVEFNNYDPEVSTLLATQICARPGQNERASTRNRLRMPASSL